MAENKKLTLARTELSGLLQSCQKQIAAAVPAHLTPDRVIRMALTVFNGSSQLQECDPYTILSSVMMAAQLGLELSGPLGHAWLVPYKNQCSFQIGYRGFVELGFRSGKLESWPVRTVHAADFLELHYGTRNELVHRPAMKDRGEEIGYYSVLKFKGGGDDFFFMSKEDAEKHRDRYCKAKGSSSPWQTHFGPMAQKTTVRMLAKRAPLSPEIQRATHYDEMHEQGLPVDIGIDLPQRTASDRAASLLAQHDAAKPVTQATREQIIALAQSLAVKEDAVEGFMREQGFDPEKLTEEQGQQVLSWLQAMEPAQTA